MPTFRIWLDLLSLPVMTRKHSPSIELLSEFRLQLPTHNLMQIRKTQLSFLSMTRTPTPRRDPLIFTRTDSRQAQSGKWFMAKIILSIYNLNWCFVSPGALYWSYQSREFWALSKILYNRQQYFHSLYNLYNYSLLPIIKFKIEYNMLNPLNLI